MSKLHTYDFIGRIIIRSDICDNEREVQDFIEDTLETVISAATSEEVSIPKIRKVD